MNLPYTPPLTKKYFEEFVGYINRGEPFSLIGMYDAGHDYVFSLLSEVFGQKSFFYRHVFLFNAQEGMNIFENFVDTLQIKRSDIVNSFKNLKFLIEECLLYFSCRHIAVCLIS